MNTQTTHPRPTLPDRAAGVWEFLWPMALAVVGTLAAWVLVPSVLFGWQPIAVVSGSMAPAIPAGHVVLAEPYGDQALRPGAVVTYRDPRADRLVTHRVAEVREDGTLTTRGDASAAADPIALHPSHVVGVGRLVVPAAGLPSLWAIEGRHQLLASMISAAVVALAAGVWPRPSGRRRHRPRHLRRRPWRAAARMAAVAVVAATVVVAGVSHASFAATHTNAGNAFAALTVAPPTGLTTTYRCVLLGLVQRPTVGLAWTASADATGGYEIWRSTSPDSGFTLLGSVTGTSWDDTPVALATTYHYRVRAVAGDWVSSAATASVTTPLLCLV